MRCVNLLETPDEGRLAVGGFGTVEARGGRLLFTPEGGAASPPMRETDLRRLRRGIGMIFQHFNLLDRSTVFENVAYPLRYCGMKKDGIERRVLELLELVELRDKADAYPSQLSGGQKQRVAIARALTMEPRYLLCDECTSALDPKSTQAILALLKNLCEKIGLTIIMVTHEMAVVESICQRMAVLESGRIVAIGDVGEMFRNKPEELRRLLGDGVSEVSITLPSEDLEKCKAFLDSEGMAYKISRGF